MVHFGKAVIPVFRVGRPIWVKGFWKIRVFMNDAVEATYWRTTSLEQTILDIQREMEKIADRYNGKTVSWKQSKNNMHLAFKIDRPLFTPKKGLSP